MTGKSQQGPNLETLSMLDERGGRTTIHPADVKGRFKRLKPLVFGIFIAIYVGLPFLSIGGQPAVRLDLPARRFFLFGATFNAQDAYMVFFLLSGVGFLLIVMSALWGRIWCGWACPQTVFLDGVFRRVERWIEGPAARRKRLDAAPWGAEKIARKGAKHAIYVLLAIGIAAIFVSYFIGVAGLGDIARKGPASHPAAFAWLAAMAGVFYWNFWWFREQLCIVICPYGRLQSVLQDKDTFIIGYDRGRGEPRGKASDPDAGDCVDCGRCVAVCPTGIDIRHGLQLECIGCAYCIDACDDIMGKLDRPRGLIRYDSERGLETGKRRFWRPRVAYYVIAGLVGLGVAGFMTTQRIEHFEANVLRVQGVPFQVLDEGVRNQVMVHVVNKNPGPATFTLSPKGSVADWAVVPQPSVELASFADHKMQVVITVPRDAWKPDLTATFDVHDSASGTRRDVRIGIVGPRRLAAPRRPTP